MKKRICLWLSVLLLFLTACGSPQEQVSAPVQVPAADETEITEGTLDIQEIQEIQDAQDTQEAQEMPAEDGIYDSREDVALYLHLYGHLPSNYITKKEAQDLGWEGGSLEPYAPGKCIGGSRFGNYEGLLPEADGRVYTECDIDTLGAEKRGAKRIVFSNDGLIYYTEDHYESFELLYGGDENDGIDSGWRETDGQGKSA